MPIFPDGVEVEIIRARKFHRYLDGLFMYEDKMDNPWFQRMALIETLTDEEKIHIYPRESDMT